MIISNSRKDIRSSDFSRFLSKRLTRSGYYIFVIC